MDAEEPSDPQTPAQKAWATRSEKGDDGTEAAAKAWATRRSRGDDGTGAARKAVITRKLNELLPDPGRTESLNFLADSVEYAASIAPDRWALTFTNNGADVRLNVAKPQVIHLARGLMHIEVDASQVPPELLERLEEDGRSSRWMRQPPQALSLQLTPAEVADWGGQLRPAHNATIQGVAATTSVPSTYQAAHSFDLLSYLKRQTGRDLPDPSYVKPGKWDEAVAICLELLANRETFTVEERDYKLEISERVRALAGATADDQTTEALVSVLRAPNNLLSWQVADDLRTFVRADPQAFRGALEALVNEAPAAERVDSFSERLPKSFPTAPSHRLSIASMFLMGLEPAKLPMWRAEPFRIVEKVLERQLPAAAETLGETYEHHIAVANELRDRVSAAGGNEIDMLDAQSLIWMLATKTEPRIVAWRGEVQASNGLAAAIADFKQRTGYPSAWDKLRFERREELKAALAQNHVSALQKNELAAIFSDRKYGHMSFGGVTARHTTEESGDEQWNAIISAIDGLLYSNGSYASRMDDFMGMGISGFKEAVATKLLAIVHHEEILPVFTFHGGHGKEILMQHELLGLDDPGGVTPGEKAMLSNDALFELLTPHFGTDTWGMSRFLYDLGGDSEKEKEPEDDSLAALNEELYLEAGFLEGCRRLIEDKRQLVFYGPPGTGKTYIARKFGRFLARGGAFEIVQFHPSYSYEDFVQGYRPATVAGSLQYEVLPGPLLRLAQRAETKPDKTYVLLIDEINRGNLPRIFGELLFALEYRDEEVRLMYGGGDATHLRLPKNLLVLATMNTADRSIGLIDAALRRRFHFRALFPAKPPIDDSLRLFLQKHVPEMAEVADVVDELNLRLRDRLGEHLQVGHSHFMKQDLSEDKLEQIWEADIIPFLEDQLFGETEALKEFTLEAVRSGRDVTANDDEDLDADDRAGRVADEVLPSDGG